MLESTFSKAGLEKPGETTAAPPDTNRLKHEIDLLNAELALWRQGMLSVEQFHETLRQAGLSYNPVTNSIQKLA